MKIQRLARVHVANGCLLADSIGCCVDWVQPTDVLLYADCSEMS